MSTVITVKRQVHFGRGCRSKKELLTGASPKPVPLGNVPRVSKLMALAIRLEALMCDERVRNQAEIARLGHVSRARVTQIMRLLDLAPDIQAAILFLPRTVHGKDPITERTLRPIVEVIDWTEQRRRWAGVTKGHQGSG